MKAGTKRIDSMGTEHTVVKSKNGKTVWVNCNGYYYVTSKNGAMISSGHKEEPKI